MGIKEMAKILPGTVIIFAVLWLTAHSSSLESDLYFNDSSNNTSGSTSTAEESGSLSLPRGGRRAAWSKEENEHLKSDNVQNEHFTRQKNSSRVEKWRLKKLVDYIISFLTKNGDTNNSLNNLTEKEESVNANQTKSNKADVSPSTFNDNNPKPNSIALANIGSNNLNNDRISNNASRDTDVDNTANIYNGSKNDGNDLSTVENESSEKNKKFQNVENNEKKTSSSMNVASDKYRNYDNGNNEDGANKPDKEAQPPDDNNSNLKEFISISDVPQAGENEFISKGSQPSSSVQNDILTTKSEPSNNSQDNFQNASSKYLQNAQNNLSNSRSPSLQNDENEYISKEAQLFSDNSKESTKIVPQMSQKSSSQKLQNSTRSNLSQEKQREPESYSSSDFPAYESIDSSSEESNISSVYDDCDSDFENSNEDNLEYDSSYENCLDEAEENATTQRPESSVGANEKILQKTPREMENANFKSVASDKLSNSSDILSFTTSIENSASFQQAHILQNNKTGQTIKNVPNQTPSKQEEIVSDSKDSKENSAGVANGKEKSQSLYKNKILQSKGNTTKSIKISENKSKELFQQEQIHADRNTEDTTVDGQTEKENTQSLQQNKVLQNTNNTPEATDIAENEDEERSQDEEILTNNKQTEESKFYSVNENKNTQSLQQDKVLRNRKNSVGFSKFSENKGKDTFQQQEALINKKHLDDTLSVVANKKENTQYPQQNEINQKIDNTVESITAIENKGIESSQQEHMLTDRNSVNTSNDAENDKEERRYRQQKETVVNKIYSTSPDSFSLEDSNEQTLKLENTKNTDYVASPTNFATDDMKYFASMQTSTETIDNTKSSTNYIKGNEVANTLKQDESITNNIYAFNSPSDYKNQIESGTSVDVDSKKTFLGPTYAHESPNLSINNKNTKPSTSEETYDTILEYIYKHSNSSLFKAIRKENSRNRKE